MSGFIHILLTHLKDTLFQPKDYFERNKRRATTVLIVPLIAIVATESVVLAILSALQLVEIRAGSFLFRLIGAASGSFLELSLAVLFAFTLLICSNLYYAYRVKQSAESLERLNKELQRKDAYNMLKGKYAQFLESGNTEQAYLVAGLLINNYRDEVLIDSEFLDSIISAGEIPRLVELRRMLSEAPRSS